MDIERAKWLALYYLGIKARTEQEMRKKLTEKGADAKMCDRTIEFLTEYGYIDDSDYVRRYVSDAVNLKKHGKKRIFMDLRRKGISDELIETALLEIEPEDTADNLAQLIAVKSKNLDLKDPKHKNRVIGFLVRRGYSYNEIFEALNLYMEDEDV